IVQGSRYWTITLLSAADGRLAFTGNVATAPAKLSCDGGVTFTAQFDSTAQESFFSFSDMHGGGDPTTPVSLTNCNLLDSSATSPIYANIPNINNIISTPLAAGGLAAWVAEIPTLNNGVANYIVDSLQGSKPAASNPNAFSHWLMRVTPITNGSLIFSGNITGVTQPLYLVCNAQVPIKLSADYKVDLATLHGNDNSALIEKDYPTCTLETDPSQPAPTSYATFAVTGLLGDYHTTAASAPMWGINVNNIQDGNQTAIMPNATPVTNVCDATDPSRCNQVTINFGNTLNGVLIIHGVSLVSAPTLSCNNNVYHFTPTGGDANSVQFDLKALHDAMSTDASMSVDYTCEMFSDRGSLRLGDVSLSALNGIRNEAGTAGQTMWSTLTRTAGDLTLDATQPAGRHCDQTGVYCDDWSATYNR
ncbi:MAG: hypothetical protein K5Q00_01580, partial [Gammaproteobacteria bacterium]|nr:hypothetical protein [Gammaproteobacteria bacterium]